VNFSEEMKNSVCPDCVRFILNESLRLEPCDALKISKPFPMKCTPFALYCGRGD
jgi:hypothetical protein